MQSNHVADNSIQTDELAKAFIKLIEKVSNVKSLVFVLYEFSDKK